MSETIQKKHGLTTNVKVRLDTDTVNKIDQLAAEYNITRSHVIRETITGTLEKMNDKQVNYIDKRQAQVINKNIIKLGNILVDVQTQLRRIGTNFNQLVRRANSMPIVDLQKDDRLIRRDELDDLVKRLEVVSKKLGEQLYVFTNF